MKSLQNLLFTLLLSASHCIKATTSAHLTDLSATYTQQIDISDIDNCIIDKIIKKEENQASPFHEITSKDIAMAILSFVSSQDLVACSKTCQKFYTLVNQHDKRHELLAVYNKGIYYDLVRYTLARPNNPCSIRAVLERHSSLPIITTATTAFLASISHLQNN